MFFKVCEPRNYKKNRYFLFEIFSRPLILPHLNVQIILYSYYAYPYTSSLYYISNDF